MPRFNNDGRTQKFVHMGGGGGRKFNGGEQDDRNPFRFSMQNKSRAIQRKPKGNAFSRLDEAGDVVMDPNEPGSSRGNQGQVQFQGHKGKGGKQWRNKQNRPKDNNSFGPGWHKITILNGSAYDRNFVLNAMRQLCRVEFFPIAYTPLGTNTAFYVEDRAKAEALVDVNGKISTPTEQKIFIRVNACGTPPTANFDETCEAKFKSVLASRYNANLQTLSLQDFSSSPELIADYFLPLYRPSVVQKLTEYLQPLLTTMVGLDLSNNKLPTLDGLHRIITKATALKALNLRGNRIREFHQFDRLQGLPIIELILEGNPVCDKAPDKETYISAVRKRFPKVVKLDGNDLPAPISFDVSEPSTMPEVKASSFCNEEAKKVILRFWELYVTIYDADDRQPLLDAYQDTASMSMMAAYSQSGHVSQIEPWKKLSVYLSESRNHVRQTDKAKRFRLLHQGKVDIVSFLNKLPKTIHDHNSYVIDMPVAVENFILFNVTGIFKERDDRHQPMRYFSRAFTLVPQNGGFVIINEMLSITNPTTEQIKTAFKPPAPTPSPSPIPQQPAAVGVVPVPTDEERRQMLVSFVQQSGMNEEWARRCLEENAWDFNRSALNFTQLKAENKIPPEAFVK